MCKFYRCIRQYLTELSRDVRDRLHPVIHIIYLSVSRKLPVDCLFYKLQIVLHNIRLDRQPVDWRLFQQTDVAQTDQTHMQGSRNWCCRECQHIHIFLHLLDLFLVLDAEPLFLVNDQKSQIFKYNILGKQPVCTDHNINHTGLHLFQRLFYFLRRTKPGQHADIDRIVLHTLTECIVMLLGKNRRRYQICYLPVILHCLKRSADCNLCLSKSYIPTDKTIHDLATFHVVFGIVNGFLLIQCLLIWEHLFKLPLPYGILRIFVTLCARTDRIQLDQLLRNILHMSLDTCAHFLPLRSAKLIQFDTCAILAGQLADAVELFHRHKQFTAFRILDTDIVLHASIGFHLVDTAVDSDTMILMYDIIANRNI